MSVRIKICGLFRMEDAQAVNAAMPDYAGFVFAESSRRNVTAELAGRLRAAIRPAIRTVGVFVNAPLWQIAALYRSGLFSVAQLHGGEDGLFADAMRTACPGLLIWQAYKMRTETDRQNALRSHADLVLLDGGAGEGRAFPWALAERFNRPFILAGGLTPDTIPQAIARLRPYGVDLSSGVETDGVKDAEKIRSAVAAARRHP
jgi:phosphoribosylanthranilate isomerase